MKTLFAVKTVRVLTFILLAMGALCLLISVLLLGLSALGHLGVLADVGSAGNRDMGIQLLSLGLPPLIGGVVLCAPGLLVFAWNRRRGDPRPGPAVLK